MALPPRGTGDNIVGALVRKGCRCIMDQYSSHTSSRRYTISTHYIQQPDGEERTFQTFLFAIFPAASRPEVHSRARTRTQSSPGSPELVAGSHGRETWERRQCHRLSSTENRRQTFYLSTKTRGPLSADPFLRLHHQSIWWFVAYGVHDDTARRVCQCSAPKKHCT